MDDAVHEPKTTSYLDAMYRGLPFSQQLSDNSLKVLNFRVQARHREDRGRLRAKIAEINLQ